MTLTVEVHLARPGFALDAAFSSQGGVTALFGPSGSGKTTLLSIIAGLVRPDRGRIAIDGDIVLDTGRRIFVPAHCRDFATVFQEARLFPHMSVRANLLYGQRVGRRPAPAQSLAQIVAMLDIGPLLSRNPATLSGGEKQRVAIGRALLSSPRLLLMDEPLSSLDEARKAEILPYLERLRDETRIPIVYVSHTVAEVTRLASHVVRIAAGRTTEEGSVTDILSRPRAQGSDGHRDAGTVIEGHVVTSDPAEGLTTVTAGALTFLVPLTDHPPGLRLRLTIPARDITIATVRPEGLSALNIFPGTITRITDGTPGTVEIGIDCAGTQLTARITALSRTRLGLEPGRQVHAIIKSVTLEG